LPAICIETRHTKAVLKAQVNKSDRNDARGIAQMMRVNLFRPVHVKTLASQKRRALLTARKLLQEKAIAIENDIRGLLRNFGLKVGAAGVIKFEERVRELVEGMPDLAEIMASLLDARQKLREQVRKLHRKLLSIVREDKVCRRLMTVPGVGALIAATVRTVVQDAHGFKTGRDFSAWIGLTPRAHSSGGKERLGAISKRGNQQLRTLLIVGATSILKLGKRGVKLPAWLAGLMARKPFKLVAVALANKTARTIWALLVKGGIYRKAVLPTPF
jgi:transposase